MSRVRRKNYVASDITFRVKIGPIVTFMDLDLEKSIQAAEQLANLLQGG